MAVLHLPDHHPTAASPTHPGCEYADAKLEEGGDGERKDERYEGGGREWEKRSEGGNVRGGQSSDKLRFSSLLAEFGYHLTCYE